MTASENTLQPNMPGLLREEINATGKLVESLEAERRSIIETDSDALANAVHDKVTALEYLQQLELRRISLVEAAGFSPDPDGMTGYLERGADSKENSRLWKQLMEQTVRCRDQNRENFQLVEMYSQHTRQVLCILRGEDPGQEVYSPAGVTRDPHEKRSLAKA